MYSETGVAVESKTIRSFTFHPDPQERIQLNSERTLLFDVTYMYAYVKVKSLCVQGSLT